MALSPQEAPFLPLPSDDDKPTVCISNPKPLFNSFFDSVYFDYVIRVVCRFLGIDMAELAKEFEHEFGKDEQHMDKNEQKAD